MRGYARGAPLWVRNKAAVGKGRRGVASRGVLESGAAIWPFPRFRATRLRSFPDSGIQRRFLDVEKTALQSRRVSIKSRAVADARKQQKRGRATPSRPVARAEGSRPRRECPARLAPRRRFSTKVTCLFGIRRQHSMRRPLRCVRLRIVRRAVVARLALRGRNGALRTDSRAPRPSPRAPRREFRVPGALSRRACSPWLR